METTAPERVAPWTRSERIYLGVVLAVALAMRLVHWWSLAGYPWFDFLGLDAKYYDEWAQRILKEGLIGKDPYFMGPLYPHLLAMVYAVVGRSLDAMRLLQVLLSTATVAGLHLLARAYGGVRLARVTSGLAAVYGPLVYYSVSLLYPTVTVFLAVALLYSLHRAAGNRSTHWTFAAGAVLGIFALGRGNILLFAPVAFVWLVTAWGHPFEPRRHVSRESLRAGAVLAGATLLFILPATFHNSLTGDPTLLTTNGGLNLYIGNGPMARGGHETPILYVEHEDGTTETITADLQKDVECRTEAEQVTGHSMKYTEVSRFWADRTFDYIRAHPGEFVSRIVMKFVHFWSAYEIPQIEHFGYFRKFSAVLRGPVVSFGLLAPLSFVGMAFAWRRRRRFALPFLFVATYCAAVVIFFVLARYRIPVVAGLLVFAALGILGLWDALREGRWRTAGTAVAGLLLGVVLVHANPYHVDEELGIAQILYRNGIVSDSLGDWEGAIGHYRDALALKPQYAKCHMNLGVDLARTGRREEALAQLETAEQLDPEYYRAPHNRAQLLEQMGRPEEALAAYRRALELEPRYLLARAGLAELLLAEGTRADVEEQLDLIETYDDRWETAGHDQARARAARLRAYLAERDDLAKRGVTDCFAGSRTYRRAEVARLRGDYSQALAQLGRYFTDGGHCGEAYRALGIVLTAVNEKDGARDAYERASAAEPGLPGVHLGLARVAAVEGDSERALEELDRELRVDPGAAEPCLEKGLVYDRLLADSTSAQEWFGRYLERGGDPAVLAGRRSAWRRQSDGSRAEPPGLSPMESE